MTKILATITVALALAGATTTANASSSRACAGKVVRHAPGATLTGDRIRAQGGASCAFARYLVRSFLSAQVRDINCAGAASDPELACVLRGRYECNKAEARAYCMDQGYGVTFRERDRDSD